MLQRDYILELISQFVAAITNSLKLAYQQNDPEACKKVEQQVGDLLDLDADTAMSLAPDSLVTMMILSGMGDSVASYVCYALDRLSLVYDKMGEEDLSGLRHLQAKAVAESFECDPSEPPEELRDFDNEVFGKADGQA
ncbi:MAG: hypothetical protein ACOYJL_02150 [Tractidigestivibacter sp.]|jgi:hypothetical protein|uniref:hypothetical protein n=1 Tax=Tractidigestivibacter sp. TaxID=2847320 RepID=UPI003D937255